MVLLLVFMQLMRDLFALCSKFLLVLLSVFKHDIIMYAYPRQEIVYSTDIKSTEKNSEQ